jgi:hypothetical protein
MQRIARALVGVLMSSTVVGCSADRAALLDEHSLVGDYVFESMEPDTTHGLDRLELKADGKYVRERRGVGQSASRQEGIWRLYAGHPPNVVVDNVGYPIEVKGKQVRLLINDDLGQWYAKVR